MSEDEMIEEFKWRASALLAREAATIGSAGEKVYDAETFGVVMAPPEYKSPRQIQGMVATRLGPKGVFVVSDGKRGKILVEDYEAEEFLKDMRAHMVLDDLADV